MTRALQLYHSSNDTAHNSDHNEIVDFIQERLDCCGITNASDWFIYSPYSMELDKLPSSCCGLDEPKDCPETDAYSEVSILCH